MRTVETKLAGEGVRVGLVVARFNHLITRRLVEGCEGRLRQLGCEETEVLWVPGAFEVPLGAQEAARTGRYDALVAIAVVVRGDTPHFDYVCRGVTDGVRQVGLEQRIPVAFCVLTTETVEQALVRAARPGEPGINKGAEAAEVAVEMASLLRQLASEA
ncbi:MAG: 6,7-dimethyl-8-ribityllumazine synthase [Myxococcota bacterium]